MKFKRAILVEPGRFELMEVEESPGAGEVLIEVSSCGLCNWELNFWKGTLENVRILGHEWCGVIVEVGEGVNSRKIGD